MWRVQSYQSASAATAFDLNNGDYYAYIEDKDRLQLMPTIKPVAISRGKYPPTIVGKVREMDKTKITIRIRATDWRTALKNLSAACANDEDDLGTLTVADENGDGWTIQVNVENILRTGYKNVYEMPLNVPDMIWRKVAAPDNWDVTATEQSITINNVGNRVVLPKFTMKAISVKADGFLYRRWVSMRNPHDRGYAYKSVDLTDGGVDTRDWIKVPSIHVQIDAVGGITNSQTTIPYDTLTGSVPTYGMGYITDGVNVEQICWTGRTGSTSGNLTGVTRGIGGTSPHAFANNVLIYLSYCKMDMSDVRIYKNRLEQNCWISGPNTASTKIWIVASEPPGHTFTLGQLITAGQSVTEIFLKSTVANYNTLNEMPDEGIVRFGDEAFHYYAKDPHRFMLEVDARSINDTTAEQHVVDDSGYYIAGDYWLFMGNPFMDAQDTNNTREPIIDKTESDNEDRVYYLFGERDGLRSDAWKGAVELTSNGEAYKASVAYTGNHTDNTADPFTDMGMKISSVLKQGIWKQETGRIVWLLYEPGGIASITQVNYELFRSISSWPTYLLFEKSRDGVVWETVASFSAPTVPGAWSGPTTIGPYSFAAGYYHLRFMMWGTQVSGGSGGVGYKSAMEVNSLTYKTSTHLVPEIMPIHSDTYEYNLRLVNQTTKEYFKVLFDYKINKKIEIDCVAKTFVTESDGRKYRAAIFVPSGQKNWMSFVPGNNTIKIYEDGVTGLSVKIDHEDQLAI